ncbi:MAG: flagellar hook-basal body complex protein [Sulfurimonas sp.]|uniref:flagellar hook protein FlgE n=1 Tax=Sulfurimonas sp. TaxID=2022749 RepID=UPI002608747E|nr:flagellar hook-basal body complex protein [Sulfurimonas sp.]MDD2652008.1 flagellar hook-basal body complex protein [Sulfurimonas sp.]MDD3451866.1 flagellar hook-basal body complex protein [Sulfurimonas sp.]
MIQGFYTGISGIQTHQYGIDVVADNLSNISTNGFRAYVAEFSSLFENSESTALSSSVDGTIGVGSRVHAVSMDESVGTLALTQRSTDLAILGDGWFGIQGEQEPIYTRDGSFVFDVNRDLVTNDGYYVLGTMGNNIADGVLTEALVEVPLGDVNAQQKLRFPQELTFPIVPTTEVDFFGNIGVEDAIKVVSAEAIDAEGNRNTVRLEFSKADPQVLPGSQWDIKATAQSREQEAIYDAEANETVYLPAEVYDTQFGSVSFDASGALLSTTLGSINNNGTSVALNLGSMYEGIISFDSTFSASSQSNGKEGGDLVGYDINQNGQIIATFSNGEQSSIGTVAVFHFANNKGLDRISGTRFMESSNSGEPLFYKDANGQNILGTALANFRIEGSNVEMAAGLTELIVLQRSYDANAKSITTADEMLQKALNMSA